MNSTPRVPRTAILEGPGRIGTEKDEEAKIQHFPAPSDHHLDAENKSEFSKDTRKGPTSRNLAAAGAGRAQGGAPPMDSSSAAVSRPADCSREEGVDSGGAEWKPGEEEGDLA